MQPRGLFPPPSDLWPPRKSSSRSCPETALILPILSPSISSLSRGVQPPEIEWPDSDDPSPVPPFKFFRLGQFSTIHQPHKALISLLAPSPPLHAPSINIYFLRPVCLSSSPRDFSPLPFPAFHQYIGLLQQHHDGFCDVVRLDSPGLFAGAVRSTTLNPWILDARSFARSSALRHIFLTYQRLHFGNGLAD